MLDLENCKDDFERQLAHIQHELATIKDMPEEVKKYLHEIQQELFKVVELKTAMDEEQVMIIKTTFVQFILCVKFNLSSSRQFINYKFKQFKIYKMVL